MINIKEIEYYNKVLAYARGKYRTWDSSEDKALREAAPLVKFTLSKTMRQTEDRHINEVLNYASLCRATHVVITCERIQFFVNYDSMNMLDASYTRSDMIRDKLIEMSKKFFGHIETDARQKLTTIEPARYQRFVSVLPHDTKRDGLYIKTSSGAYTLQRNRKTLIQIYDQQGYVSRPGTPPTVVSPHEMSKNDMSQVLDVLNFCTHMGHDSVWSKALARPLNKCVTNYRSLQTQAVEQQIRRVIAATR
jgi:hypothetical protein